MIVGTQSKESHEYEKREREKSNFCTKENVCLVIELSARRHVFCILYFVLYVVWYELKDKVVCMRYLCFQLCIIHFNNEREREDIYSALALCY